MVFWAPLWLLIRLVQAMDTETCLKLERSIRPRLCCMLPTQEHWHSEIFQRFLLHKLLNSHMLRAKRKQWKNREFGKRNNLHLTSFHLRLCYRELVPMSCWDWCKPAVMLNPRHSYHISRIAKQYKQTKTNQTAITTLLLLQLMLMQHSATASHYCIYSHISRPAFKLTP